MGCHIEGHCIDAQGDKLTYMAVNTLTSPHGHVPKDLRLSQNRGIYLWQERITQFLTFLLKISKSRALMPSSVFRDDLKAEGDPAND